LVQEEKKSEGEKMTINLKAIRRFKEETKARAVELVAKFVKFYEKHHYPLAVKLNVDEEGMNFNAVSNYTLDLKVSFLSHH